MKKDGYSENTIEPIGRRLRNLAKHVNLNRPEEVKEFIASSLITWAFLYLSTTKPIPTTVTIAYTTSIGVYWKLDATDPVESVDFLVLLPGQTAYHTLYLKNEGSSTVRLVWYSICSERTGNKIVDIWTYAAPYPGGGVIDHYYLDPGDILETYYAIDTSSDIPSDTYNWCISI